MSAMRVCSVPGCPTIYPRQEGSRCRGHRGVADRRRGTSAERGYASAGHRAFRDAVLRRDPVCVVCGLAEATVADHFPRSRRQLAALGLNPNDARFGRGLCGRCHSAETARHQPGGWADRGA